MACLTRVDIWRDRMAGALAAGLFASIFVTPAHAQSPRPQYVATVWQTEQGLPQSSVYDMVKDRDGYLWLATWGGLARFDGTRFRVFGSADVPGLGSVTSIREDAEGEVWINTSDVRLPPVGRRQWAGVYPEAGVLAMATDTDGELLLLTPAGFVRVVNGRHSPAEPLPVPASGGDVPKALSLLVDREDTRWIGTLTMGLHRLRPAPVTAYGKEEGLSDSAFRSVFQDRDGRIWLYRLRASVPDIHQDSTGTLWMTSAVRREHEGGGQS